MNEQTNPCGENHVRVFSNICTSNTRRIPLRRDRYPTYIECFPGITTFFPARYSQKGGETKKKNSQLIIIIRQRLPKRLQPTQSFGKQFTVYIIQSRKFFMGKEYHVRQEFLAALDLGAVVEPPHSIDPRGGGGRGPCVSSPSSLRHWHGLPAANCNLQNKHREGGEGIGTRS